MKYEPVIGLEIHLQLNTKTKLFCSCASGVNQPDGANSAVCPVCLAHPGTLPVLNKEAVSLAVKAALGLNLHINQRSVFSRKNYFYPDLPKGYQISQYDEPVSERGHLDIDGRKIGITRAHMEEDAGKSIHRADASLIDFNRSGTPLLEIVTDPDIRSADEAYNFLTELKRRVKWLGASNADMELGELRVDVNISLRPEGQKEFGRKVEVKNLNSFKAVRDAINHEIERQTAILSSGGRVSQDTMTFDKETLTTRPMRSKEDAVDYHYFPDPDLKPLVISDEWLDGIKAEMPEMPDQREARFAKDYGLSDYDAGVLTSSRAMAEYFEEIVKAGLNAKSTTNWITTDLLGALNADKKEIEESPISAAQLSGLIKAVDSGKISRGQGKKVFEEMWKNGGDAEAIIAKLGFVQISDEGQLETWAKEAIAENPKIVDDIKGGNDKAKSALIGAVMKKSKGKANAAALAGIFNKLLG
ncbi:Asp-tRNA(Asn)/Glu-tRNA(Gln) amidotransferase subunit GatB [Parelusimicrobium proximum]|uniref:Asp-tRNA(Asn)/Glu-tRNA(Gln) amidotransferase subunit GatB n=1 Tax=Parelusimicrobium proximum TaxID=3228953 RepID=UPI003D17A8C1